MKTSRLLFLLLATITFTFLSCSNDGNKRNSITNETEEEKGENVGSPLDIFVSNFIKNHPDIENNDLTFENARKDFSKEFDEQLKSGFLNNMTFRCLQVNKDIITKKITATFSLGVTSKDSSYAVDVFLHAPINDSTANQLKQFSDYKIQGTITKPKDKLASKYDLGPTNVYFSKKTLMYSTKNCIVISVHGLQLTIKNFTKVNDKN